MTKKTRLVFCILAVGLLILIPRNASPAQGKAFQSSDQIETCGTMIPGQPIPDDGTWLQVCLIDSLAPIETTVTTVSIKYLIKHPDPTQLEVRVSRKDESAGMSLWEQGKAAAATEYGYAVDIEAFQGTPSRGEWYLWIRDVIPGQSGLLSHASLVVNYLPKGPLPVVLSGPPGRPYSRYLPDGIVPSQTPDPNPEKEVRPEIISSHSNGWQIIKHENFEGYFPNEGWARFDGNPNDGKEYLWDDDNHRHNLGYYAAWPARAGVDGYDPSTTPSYPPNMNSWMVYGPFDLSDAVFAQVNFELWRQIETIYDQVGFLYSSDMGASWEGLYWDGVADWQEMQVDISHLAGETNVLIAWVFESDSTVEYEGAWVDDVWILKAQPETVNVQGRLSYQDRKNLTAYGRNYRVSLYEYDADGQDDLLLETYTDRDGYFYIPDLWNLDVDEHTYPENPSLDLYVVWKTDNPELNQHVTNFVGTPYQWQSRINLDSSAGTTVTLDTHVPDNWATQPAMWIFEDILRAYEYMLLNTGVDPGAVAARWEKDQNYLFPCPDSCFYAGPGGPYIFIEDDWTSSGDIVVHEVGHHYLYNMTGGWLWNNPYCYEHYMFREEDADCAWSEGWADFLPLVVNGDPCYDFDTGPCSGEPEERHYNLESHNLYDPPPPPSSDRGDLVEGRVAGALYDLFDTANEDFDSDYFGMAPLTEAVFQGPFEESFFDFWESWKAASHSQHNAVRTFYQNTIDYDTPPYFESLLPDLTVLQGAGWDHVIDLWSYSLDEESESWELDWQIVYTSDPRCGVTIDENDYVNIYPQAGGTGSCYITIQVSDSLKTAQDTFRVDVVPVRSRVYLPTVFQYSP